MSVTVLTGPRRSQRPTGEAGWVTSGPSRRRGGFLDVRLHTRTTGVSATVVHTVRKPLTATPPLGPSETPTESAYILKVIDRVVEESPLGLILINVVHRSSFGHFLVLKVFGARGELEDVDETFLYVKNQLIKKEGKGRWTLNTLKIRYWLQKYYWIKNFYLNWLNSRFVHLNQGSHPVRETRTIESVDMTMDVDVFRPDPWPLLKPRTEVILQEKSSSRRSRPSISLEIIQFFCSWGIKTISIGTQVSS